MSRTSRRSRSGPRLTSIMLCIGFAVAACGGTDGDSSEHEGATPTDSATEQAAGGSTDEEAVATLAVYDDAAELAFATAAEDFGPAGDGDPVDVGDTVRTDDTGFAQLDFADGSLARLASATTLTVVALGQASAPTVELELEVGRVWNSVRDLGEAGSYEITTDVGTAAVRGTVFLVWVREDGSTLVAVYDGEVVFTTTDGEEFVLGPGDALEFGVDGATAGPGPAPETLASDPFVRRNQAIDDTGEDPGADAGQSTETLAGDYRVTYAMTQPPEVEHSSELTADHYDGVDPYIATTRETFNGLPAEVGGTTEVVWTIGADGFLVADVPPFTMWLRRAHPTEFEGGQERHESEPVELCEGMRHYQTTLTTIEVEEVDEQVVSFTGTQVWGSHMADVGDCFNVRHTTVWDLVGERIGPPDQARIDGAKSAAGVDTGG